jgi:sphingolipid delta-4 desaturase
MAPINPDPVLLNNNADNNKVNNLKLDDMVSKQTAIPEDTVFHYVRTDEPHFTRRKQILAIHPEIKQLYGSDPKMAPQVIFCILLQIALAFLAPRLSTWEFWVCVYVVGGTLTHILSMANHELGHNLCFEEPIWNECLGWFANVAQGIPSFFAFRKYHTEHHFNLGVEGGDPDLPTEWEANTFRGRFLKALWVFLIPAFYTLRPFIVNPKPASKKEIFNLVSIIGLDLVILYYFGPWPIVYLIGSTILGMGLHPFNAHVIAEHYENAVEQETYSYYGVMNLVCFNLGYHNEHHDFPRVPHTKLHLVKKMAPEFYNDLNTYKSWMGVIADFILRRDIGIHSRIKRTAAIPNYSASLQQKKSQ